MDEMVSMRMEKKDKKHMGQLPSTAEESEGPEYPYGLEIRLDMGSLEKLGCDLSDYSVGDEVTITAKCKVKGLRSEEYGNGESDETLTLQITDMCMGEGMSEEDEELGWDEEGGKVDKKLRKRGY